MSPPPFNVRSSLPSPVSINQGLKLQGLGGLHDFQSQPVTHRFAKNQHPPMLSKRDLLNNFTPGNVLSGKFKPVGGVGLGMPMNRF